MAEIKIVAEARSEFGKGAARRIRRESKIPAVLYGHGAEPVHVTLPAHDMMLALRQANVLFSIELDGKAQLAVAKDVQRDPIRPIIEHVDLLVVKAGEKISVEVPVHVVGESFSGTMHVVETQQLTIEAEATHLPEAIEVSIDGLEAGAIITAADVVLPQGATLVTEGDHVVVTITEPKGEQAEDEAAEGAEAAAE